jgi:hypothetical protein
LRHCGYSWCLFLFLVASSWLWIEIQLSLKLSCLFRRDVISYYDLVTYVKCRVQFRSHKQFQCSGRSCLSQNEC